uniref:Uncharacterized protein n=1 Tax=Anguilla anguilla TaxID=7936 RepID=A0A0E9VZZ9_ANGAN
MEWNLALKIHCVILIPV